MKRYRITFSLKSAFGTPLKGDTLFGQLCWAILNRHGEDRLKKLLNDYPVAPFAVCSDGFPSGYLPRPSLPVRYFDMPGNEDRKVIKKKRWVPIDDMTKPLSQWLVNAQSNNDLLGDDNQRAQPHNTINRLTGTTGEDMFAPYSQPQTWYAINTKFDVYLLLDEARLPLSDVKILFSDIGAFGYGRDASIGLGKFDYTHYSEQNFPDTEGANACLTLAPCAPQGSGFNHECSYYSVFTRFGRHGDIGVHKEHGPFKAPVLLADTAAVFSPLPAGQNYIGQALGGAEQALSKTIPATVHQGYAPYVPVRLPGDREETA